MVVRHRFNKDVLREYDIRGVVGKSLAPEDARNVGRAFATIAVQKFGRTPHIAVGRDGRISSPTFMQALIAGLVEAGAQVTNIGLGPTPMLYFAVHHLNTDGGIMVTGSHNPADHNGFKMMLGKESFFGAAIQGLAVIAAEGTPDAAGGTVTEQDIKEAYVARLLADTPGLLKNSGGKSLKIGWDPGNGAAGEILQRLIQKLSGTHTVINAEIDGTFPAHHPDPTEAKNLQQLIALVTEKQLDIGIAFDGDADRIGVVDTKGRILWGDQLLLFYAREIVNKHPGAMIIADVKASRVLFDELAKMGAKPLMWKTGHSQIKSKLKETGAALAGEVSGHIFFADTFYGHDDALYAAIRLLSQLAVPGSPSFEEMVDAMPVTVATPDLRIPCPDGRKFAVIEEVRERLTRAGIAFNDVDGMRVEKPEGWWLLRASNTGELLTVRCEAGNEEDLARLRGEVSEQLKLSGITLAAN